VGTSEQTIMIGVTLHTVSIGNQHSDSRPANAGAVSAAATGAEEAHQNRSHTHTTGLPWPNRLRPIKLLLGWPDKTSPIRFSEQQNLRCMLIIGCNTYASTPPLN